MKRGLLLLIILILATGVANSLAQTTDEGGSSVFVATDAFKKPAGFVKSLLDPSRFSMSHSYSLNFGSVGPYSTNHGLYTNTMRYQFSDALRAKVSIGFLHQPFQGQNSLEIGNKLFVQQAMMQYKPSDKFTVTVDYQAYPAPMMNPYNSRYNSGFGSALGSWGESRW